MREGKLDRCRDEHKWESAIEKSANHEAPGTQRGGRGPAFWFWLKAPWKDPSVGTASWAFQEQRWTLVQEPSLRAFGEGLWDLPGSCPGPSLYKRPLATFCRCLPGRGHVEKGFRVSVRTYLAVPGPTHSKDLQGAVTATLMSRQVWGTGRQDASFTAQLEEEPSNCSSVFLNTPGGMGRRPAVLCPQPGTLCLGTERGGKADEGRGGKRRARSWRPWGPALALTFRIDVSWDKFLISSKSNHSSQNPLNWNGNNNARCDLLDERNYVNYFIFERISRSCSSC